MLSGGIFAKSKSEVIGNNMNVMSDALQGGIDTHQSRGNSSAHAVVHWSVIGVAQPGSQPDGRWPEDGV